MKTFSSHCAVSQGCLFHGASPTPTFMGCSPAARWRGVRYTHFAYVSSYVSPPSLTFTQPRCWVNTAPGAKTSLAFWMYWDGTHSVMPVGWNVHDLWLVSGYFGFNTGNSDVYGINSTGLANHGGTATNLSWLQGFWSSTCNGTPA